MVPNVVILSAPFPQSGKSTAAQHLVETYGYTLVKFAGPLKEMLRGLLRGMGFPDTMIERMVEGDMKELPLPGLETTTPRAIMQTLGTDWGRECISKNVWANVAKERARVILMHGGKVVIDDARFPNEVDTIRDAYPETLSIRIERPGIEPSTTRYENMLDREHIDVVITNDDTVDILKEALDLALVYST